MAQWFKERLERLEFDKFCTNLTQKKKGMKDTDICYKIYYDSDILSFLPKYIKLYQDIP